MAKSSTPSTPAPEARYARVKAILGAAAAGSRSDYGGLGQFWNLPLHELKEAKIYGVRLIAPAVPTPPCCEGQTSARVPDWSEVFVGCHRSTEAAFLH